MKTEIIPKLKKMAGILEEMLDLVFQGFIENDTHYLNSALNKEQILDELEKDITALVIQRARTADNKERSGLILLEQVAENIERMGDELRYLMERMEIKIAENLFFSEIGVEQYKDVFARMRKSVSLAIRFLNENKSELLEMIANNGGEIKKTIEEYRKEHLGRLAKGICQPRAANMYFDMLDFTGNIARHCTAIARIYKEK